MIGIDSAIAVHRQTLKEVVNGSAGPSVSSFLSSGSGIVQPPDQRVPEDEAEREPEDDAAQADDDPRAQLGQVLDERRLFLVPEAPG